MIERYRDDLVSLFEADCFELLASLEAGSVDLLLCDPPYSSGGAMRSDRVSPTAAKYSQAVLDIEHARFSGDSRDQRGYLAWLTLWLSLAASRMPHGASALIFTDWRQVGVTSDAVQAAGMILRNVAVWHKTSSRPNAGTFRSSSEFVVHASLGKPHYHGYFPESVFAASRPSTLHHIAQKPQAVMEWLARMCRPGGQIVDPFAGSGSTLIAARALGYRAIGGDSDPHWCDIATSRLNEVPLPFEAAS